MAEHESSEKERKQRRRGTRVIDPHFVNLLLNDEANISSQDIEAVKQKAQASAAKEREKMDVGTADTTEASSSAMNGQANLAEPCCEVTFRYRPFGFSVAPQAGRSDAVVTKVTTQRCLEDGLKIGFAVSAVAGKAVLGLPHQEILERLQTTKLPCKVAFIDAGEEYTVRFDEKPLGISILKDENGRNARVWAVKSAQAQKQGVTVDSFLIAVNGQSLWGQQHTDIVEFISSAETPLECTFRRTPALDYDDYF